MAFVEWSAAQKAEAISEAAMELGIAIPTDGENKGKCIVPAGKILSGKVHKLNSEKSQVVFRLDLGGSMFAVVDDDGTEFDALGGNSVFLTVIFPEAKFNTYSIGKIENKIKLKYNAEIVYFINEYTVDGRTKEVNALKLKRI